MVCRGDAVRNLLRRRPRPGKIIDPNRGRWRPGIGAGFRRAFDTGQGCRGRVSCRSRGSDGLRRLFGLAAEQEKMSRGDAKGAEAAEKQGVHATAQ